MSKIWEKTTRWRPGHQTQDSMAERTLQPQPPTSDPDKETPIYAAFATVRQDNTTTNLNATATDDFGRNLNSNRGTINRATIATTTARGSQYYATRASRISADETRAQAAVGTRTEPTARKHKWRIAGIAVIAALVILAIILGAVLGTRKKRGGSGGSGGGGGTSGPTGPDFPLDDRLHNSFWGLAYSPYGAIDCTATQANVTKDIKQLSQLTTRLRLYASDCNVTSLIIQAIEDLQVDMSVYAGIFIHPDLESYNSQVAQLDATFDLFGTSRILGVTIGNEYILNAQSRGDTTANATNWLSQRISDYRSHLASLSSDGKNYTNIPIGSSDAGGSYLQDLVTGVRLDYLFANIHPWFSENTYDQAAWFSWSFMQEVVGPLVNISAAAGNPGLELFQGEFGWPSDTDPSNPALGVNPAGSRAGTTELQRVLDDWVCPSNANGTKYFWFEAYDEPWKGVSGGGGVEAHWGLFDAAGNLKNITIPDCPHS